MSEGRWSPDWFDELFERFYQEAMRPLWDADEQCLEPLVEIEDRRDEVIVTVDLPCVSSKEDIMLDVTEDSLEIRARLDRSVRWERWGTSQRDVEFKAFKKQIRLPSKVDPQGAKATFRAGILRVMLPKARKGYAIKVE